MLVLWCAPLFHSFALWFVDDTVINDVDDEYVLYRNDTTKKICKEKKRKLKNYKIAEEEEEKKRPNK